VGVPATSEWMPSLFGIHRNTGYVVLKLPAAAVT
jgi:hypothetical protein